MQRFKIDPFIIGIVSCAVLGLIIPVPSAVAKVLDEIKTWAIALLFFLYGARLRSREVLKELRSWKLQGAILLATFLLCPLLAWATSAAFLRWWGTLWHWGCCLWVYCLPLCSLQ